MMQLEITPSHVDWRFGGQLVGRYHHRDPFKPHVHPLNTPGGHCLSSRSPHDHVHHRALMYGHICDAANFWAERDPSLEDLPVGVQRHVDFQEVVGLGEEAGFTETLQWRRPVDDALIITERRTIRVHRLADQPAYRWHWRSELTAVVDVELRRSGYSIPDAGGNPINYTGLGVRLRRDFAGHTGGCHLLLDNQPLDSKTFTDAIGRTPRSATYIGSIDQIWPVPRAFVTFEQAHGHALFALNKPFAFLSFGPANAANLSLQAGRTLDERYRITVGDWTQR